MEKPFILHLFTPEARVSPFDVNMAVDAGYQVLMPYTGVELPMVVGLTHDAIFSRGPKGVSRTGLFIGGRDVLLAADMLEAAQKAMVPPFVVSVCADPSGAYTTAAAMVASVQHHLRRRHERSLAGLRVLVLGGTGAVGRIAAVLAAREGATVTLSSHTGQAHASQAARATGSRFNVSLQACSGLHPEDVLSALQRCDVVLATAAAGVRVLSLTQLQQAPSVLIAADLNAVPPSGIEGLGPLDDGVPLGGGQAVGIGALAIGNVKYQVQQQLLRRMREASTPQCLSFEDAHRVACQHLGLVAA